MNRNQRLRLLVLAAGFPAGLFTPGIGLVNPNGNDTHEMYTHSSDDQDADPQYSKERDALHQYLLDENMGQARSDATPVAVFAAGGSGVGKSSMVYAMLAKEISRMVHIDPDMYKIRLPEYQQMRDTDINQAAVHVHEESSYLAKRTLDLAITNKLNLIYDSTFSNVPYLARKIQELKTAGYYVMIFYADCPFDVAMDRVYKRAQETGRMVPPEVVQQTHNQSIKGFNALKKMADKTLVFDTSGTGAREVLSYTNGQEHVEDPSAIAILLRHGHQLDSTKSIAASQETEPELATRLLDFARNYQYAPSPKSRKQTGVI